jgi:hypothetical protein
MLDAAAFEALVRKELKGEASYEEETLLWSDPPTIQRWMDLLSEMEKGSQENLKMWEDQYRQEEYKYINARIYRRTEWEEFCANHAQRVSIHREALGRIRVKKAKIYEYFSQNKETRLMQQVLDGSPEQSDDALAKLEEMYAKRLEYERRQSDYAVNWGFGFRHGGQLFIKHYKELLKLGWSVDEAAEIIRQYANGPVTTWIPFCRGAEKQDIPDFRVFLYNNHYHLGPVSEEEKTSDHR